MNTEKIERVFEGHYEDLERSEVNWMIHELVKENIRLKERVSALEDYVYLPEGGR